MTRAGFSVRVFLISAERLCGLTERRLGVILFAGERLYADDFLRTKRELDSGV